MTRSFARRLGALTAVLLAGMAVLVSAGPASAQASGPYRFSATCSGGATSGGVDVPAGTIVPGMGTVTMTTLVTSNVTVTFPSGSTAVLNEATTTTRNAIRFTSGPNNGTIIGQVICGSGSRTATALVGGTPLITVTCTNAALPPAGGASTRGAVTVTGAAGAQCDTVSATSSGDYFVTPYPLAVDVQSEAPALAAPSLSSSDGGGPSTSLLLLAGAGALGLAVLAQAVVGRRMSQRKGDATA